MVSMYEEGRLQLAGLREVAPLVRAVQQDLDRGTDWRRRSPRFGTGRHWATKGRSVCRPRSTPAWLISERVDRRPQRRHSPEQRPAPRTRSVTRGQAPQGEQRGREIRIAGDRQPNAEGGPGIMVSVTSSVNHGLVTECVFQMITKQVDDKGLVVWCDASTTRREGTSCQP